MSKILIITDSYPHPEKPYLTTFHHIHAKVLSRIGRVRVLTLIRGEKFGFRRYTWEGIEVEAFEMPYRKNAGAVFFPLSILLHFILALKNLLGFRPDVTIFQMALPHGISYVPLKFLKKYILIEHSSSAYRKNLFFQKLVTGGASLRYTVSSFYKNRLEEALGIKFHGIIPNPVPRYNWNCPFSGKKVIFAGRLDENKSPHLFILAAKLLPELEFHLIGEDTKTSYSRKILNDLPRNVIYHGPLSHKETLKMLCKSDIFVSTSKFETFGYAIAEALALGKPVVWTDSGGPRDFLNEKNSIQIKERTPESVAEAITIALDKLNNNYFDPGKIREGILRYAGVEVVESKYRKAIESIMKET